MNFVINHMTAPDLNWKQIISMAKSSGCIGVELRNDLPRQLFDGDEPSQVLAAAAKSNMRIVGLSQVYPFNAYSSEIEDKVKKLINSALECGAETICLIPLNDGTCQGNAERQANLRGALWEILTLLDGTGLIALIEPLGFLQSSLRTKEEAVSAIKDVGGQKIFKIVHDTFHHYLSGDELYFPEYTGIVHISGVTTADLSVHEMEDRHRVLVDHRDRIGNITQLRTLLDMGYDGLISLECFAPEVHASVDIQRDVQRTFEFIRSSLSDSSEMRDHSNSLNPGSIPDKTLVAGHQQLKCGRNT
ncbi:MAG: TIM barrel protein [Parvularculales bacterium]